MSLRRNGQDQDSKQQDPQQEPEQPKQIKPSLPRNLIPLKVAQQREQLTSQQRKQQPPQNQLIQKAREALNFFCGSLNAADYDPFNENLHNYEDRHGNRKKNVLKVDLTRDEKDSNSKTCMHYIAIFIFPQPKPKTPFLSLFSKAKPYTTTIDLYLTEDEKGTVAFLEDQVNQVIPPLNKPLHEHQLYKAFYSNIANFYVTGNVDDSPITIKKLSSNLQQRSVASPTVTLSPSTTASLTTVSSTASSPSPASVNSSLSSPSTNNGQVGFNTKRGFR